MAFDGNTPFSFDVDVEVFEKAGAPASKRRRIGGLVTTDSLDQQGERLVQEGLDFSHFLTKGWLNDNHSRDTAGVVGYGDLAKLVKSGDVMPNGKVASHTGWYIEGYLLDTKRASEIWELASSLQKSDRRLGFSVEGTVQKRTEVNGIPHVSRAVVRNVAITNCPVNADTALEVLAKSLAASAVQAIAPGVPAPGNGFALQPESLEGYRPRKRAKKKRRGLNKAEGVALILSRRPHLSVPTAERIYALVASHTG